MMKTTEYFEYTRTRPGPRSIPMKIKYFTDTDTALIEFSSEKVSETKEISENIYIDIDGNGNLVGMTIEHAKKSGALSAFSYEEIGNKSA